MNFVLRALSATERRKTNGELSSVERTMDPRSFDVTADPYDSSAKPIHESIGSFLQTPLTRVFARAGAEGRDFGSLDQRYETLSLQRSLQLVKETIHERRRVEELVRRPVVMLPQRQTLKTVTNTIHEEVFESPHSVNAGLTGMTRSPSLLPIDIDQLTERVVRNIDGRIVAHRERLGGVF